MPNATTAVASTRAWPKDTTVAKMAFYGDFRKSDFQSTHLMRITPPFQMYYEKKPIPSFLVNKACADAMMAAFVEIAEKCGNDQKKIDATGASDFGGCFNVREIAGSHNYSNHSWGCAVDLSPSTNGFRLTRSTTLSNIVIDAFKRQGARWGGDYQHRKDPMHFEFVSVDGHPAEVAEVSSPLVVRTDVRWLQRSLNVMRVPGTPLRVVGDYGQNTQRVVATFQRRRHIYVDGVAGPQTVAQVKQALSEIGL